LVLEDYNMVVVESVADDLKICLSEVWEVEVIDFGTDWGLQRANF
jgi:hypothetical protein